MAESLPHRPVLLKEVLEFLHPRPGMVVVDATLGAGGFSESFLQAMEGKGRVIGIDHDESALELASNRLAGWGDSFRPVKANFKDLLEVLTSLAAKPVDGIVADLGISSMQLNSRRGFSFQVEGPLDMRMRQDADVESAADVVNHAAQATLEEIFREYGEERFARRIAKAIVARRAKKEFRTTLDLAETIERVVPGRGRIHPATRCFQALRIAVNGELEALRSLCQAAPEALKQGGVFIGISYHSLEDRILKQSLRPSGELAVWNPLTKKPVTPSEEEIRENPRSRSAKLRAAMRV